MKNLILGVLTGSLISAACYIAITMAPKVPEKPMMGAAPANHEQSRSSHWPKVRAEYLEKEPVCEACGCKDDPQVHHCIPFNHDSSKELDLSNLITLCGPGGHNCHIRIGHSMDYKHYNPHVREDAALQFKRIKERLVNDRRVLIKLRIAA